MSKIVITGSTDWLGKALAVTLLQQGHEVLVHARNPQRAQAVAPLVQLGASIVIGDLAIESQVRAVAEQVNQQGRMDVVVHNAGVGAGADVVAVNVIAPYLLSALIQRPARLIYLSSSMHYSGRAPEKEERWADYFRTCTYADSKLLLTTLAFALSARWTDVAVHAVDPGWVPTKMGGRHAPDSFERGYETQAWLASAVDKQVLCSGGYWHHKKRQTPHLLCTDTAFQAALINGLAAKTQVELP